MKQKKFIVLVAVIMVLVLTVGVLAACNKKKGATTYTLHDYIGATPTNFNPHTWETSADSTVAAYAEMGLVDTTIAPNGEDFEWVYEMATSITDVTELYVGQELAGDPIVKEGVTEGQVYRIALNQDAKWENGVAINADTYIESMKRMLDSKMQNYRANSYYKGDSAILHASKFFNSQTPVYASVLDDNADLVVDDDDKVYINFAKGWRFNGNYSLNALAGYGFTDKAIANKLQKQANVYGYVEVTDDNYADVAALLDIACSAFGVGGVDDNDELTAYGYGWLWYNTGEISPEYTWDGVGLKKIRITYQEYHMIELVTRSKLAVIKSYELVNDAVYNRHYEHAQKDMALLFTAG